MYILIREQLDLWFDPSNNGVNKEARLINQLIVNTLQGTDIELLDLTHLSEFKADAHPAMWLGKKDDVSVWGQDCMHWCLPVPRTLGSTFCGNYSFINLAVKVTIVTDHCQRKVWSLITVVEKQARCKKHNWVHKDGSPRRILALKRNRYPIYAPQVCARELIVLFYMIRDYDAPMGIRGDGSSSDEWGDYGVVGDDYEGPLVFDDDQYEEESVPVYDTDIEDVIEEEEGFVGKRGLDGGIRESRRRRSCG
ncbi:trichome birefringence-like protein 12 [Tanacetum coccineum]|uniref:Trichome birefringence-like protein 12 n=1 Tax=Tanacetum coccineum TaxID=301880 RepID=A0ABQ5AYL5_9ASTR